VRVGDVKDYAGEAMAAVRAALMADPAFWSRFPGGVHDDAPAGVAFPHITFGRLEVVSDDADLARGAVVQMGLEIHARPDHPAGGRVAALSDCAFVASVLHLDPDALAPIGVTVWEIEVQTYVASRSADGASYQGTIALQVSMDA
jgi:hypothetical protein